MRTVRLFSSAGATGGKKSKGARKAFIYGLVRMDE